ncbi:hypothetical protein [Rodentibacter haemolyticus]|uniref:DUF600 domain-containing protein n=1 Tax=Rodentibacter haemolyticus TaxID=2778911 RepID=A0ABX6UWR9_9PAST|nr:hypothetical protein [Rodentibacter haemolyticus]QPB41636.1 hypothetical protein IHV77_06710 [Rodentibacter haemolyticus]
MNEQLDLLQKIYDEFHSSRERFDYLEYTYKFNPDENWVGTELFTSENGVPKMITLDEELEEKIQGLCNELHMLMQIHTGGDWRKLIFTIENGKVKTKFIYDVQSCMDQFKEL